jgi:twitching motility protein PilT
MAIGLTTLLRTLVDNHATSLIIRGNSNAHARISAKVRVIDDSFLTNDDVKKIAVSIMGEREKALFAANKSVDFSLDAKEFGRFRFNVYMQSDKHSMVVRHIPLQIPSFSDLSLPEEQLTKMTDSQRGIVLVTGMTGSGKSSTLAAMLGRINKIRPVHILTIEDPVEFIHADQKAIISQMSLGVDTLSYHSALKYAMRQDPDVIMIGEMRDADVIRDAISAAELGQLVMSTMHTVNATQTIARIVKSFPAEQQEQARFQLADLLRGVICQRLIPKISGGVTPAVEVMLPTSQIKKLIMEDKINDIHKFIQDGGYYGMQTFDQSLVKLYKSGVCSMEAVLEFATKPETIMLDIKGVSDGGLR